MDDERWEGVICSGEMRITEPSCITRNDCPAVHPCSLMLIEPLRLLYAAVVLTFVCFSVSAQQVYPIKLNRSEKAGQRYHLVTSITGKTTVNITVGDQLPIRNEDVLAVELSAEVTILEASSSNWATRKRFKVLSSKLTRTGSTGSILPNSTEVIASIENGQTLYQVNQQPVSAEVTQALQLVVGLHLASVAEDDMFGTPTPKRIAESWPIGVEAVKKLLLDMGSQGGKQEITGSSTLERVEDNHVFVRGLITVRDVLLPITAGITAETGEIESELTGRFPLLQRDPTVDSSSRVYMKRGGSGVDANGKKVKLQVVYESRSRYEIRPL